MPLKVQTRNAKQECYLFCHAQLLLLGSKEAFLDIPELPNHVKAKIGRGGRPMVLLCSKWCGPTWQSGEWISLVAPNSQLLLYTKMYMYMYMYIYICDWSVGYSRQSCTVMCIPFQLRPSRRLRLKIPAARREKGVRSLSRGSVKQRSSH